MEPGQAVTVLEEFLADRGQPLLRSAIMLAGSQEAGSWASVAGH